MTILVSINNYNLPSVRIVKSFKNVEWEKVETLIFHSSTDSELEIILALSGVKEHVKKVLYINKNINPLFYCIFTGLDADIYDTEESLMDETVLEFLVDNYKNTGMTIKSPSADVETLAKCIAVISSKNVENLQKLVSNDFWVRTLSTAVSNVDTAINRASQVNIDVVEMLSETNKLIASLVKNNERADEELKKLDDLIKEMQQEVNKSSKTNTPFIYHTYRVPAGVKKVLYVKALSPSRYVNSFLMAYQHYLRMNFQINSKMLTVQPKLKYIISRYKDFPRLAKDSIGVVNLEANNYFVTYEPQKMVLDEFFGQTNVDLYIVVDMMYGDHLLEGHMVEIFYALGGLSDLERHNVDPDRAILPLLRVGNSIRIVHMTNYAQANEHVRRTMYFEHHKDMFEKLNRYTLPSRR